MPGQIGNKGGKGGSRKAPEMEKFYKKLDAACLDSVDYLAAIVKKANKKLGDDDILSADWRKDGISAAGKLIAKAPERIGNPDGTNFLSVDDQLLEKTNKALDEFLNQKNLKR